jgi:hypothetical protein
MFTSALGKSGRRTKAIVGTILAVALGVTACVTTADDDRYSKDVRRFDAEIAKKLGVEGAAFLLAINVEGRVTVFVPADGKFRIIDPDKEKLTVTLKDIDPSAFVSYQRNPLCTIYVGGTAKKRWMESCP